MAACSSELLSTVREREALPPGTASLLVSLDGVMMRMNTETVGETETDAGWREAACGVIGFVDADGNRLDARCFGQLPETGKETLKSPLTAELFHWLTVAPDLKVVAVADGAPDNGTFLEALCPDLALLGFWHAAEHLKAAADAAFGPDTAAATAWFEKWRHTLRHDANGRRVCNRVGFGRSREQNARNIAHETLWTELGTGRWPRRSQHPSPLQVRSI
ncbi:MAG: hypothetical protein OXD38_03545 [Aestuariivita sp.]|nr:hypothetical protein [Aestuariivita sp.]